MTNEMTKKIGVALEGPEWTHLLGFLMHCCTDLDLIVDLWETKEDLEEMEFLIKQIQRQVFLVQEKIKLEGTEGKKVDLAKVLSITPSVIIGADGRPLM